MASKKEGTKRYNLILPEDVFNELQQVAERRHITLIELLRRFIKLGLIAVEMEDTPGSVLVIRSGDSERQIIIV